MTLIAIQWTVVRRMPKKWDTKSPPAMRTMVATMLIATLFTSVR